MTLGSHQHRLSDLFAKPAVSEQSTLWEVGSEVPLRIESAHTSRLRTIWIAASAAGLVAVEYGVSRQDFLATVQRLASGPIGGGPNAPLGFAKQIKEYVEGKRREFDLSIDWSFMSSEFQRTVLKAVLGIPYGRTRTYAEIAAAIGRPNAARAVGRANATNPMPLVIPCHRLIGTDGGLRGYGGVGGIRTKAWLLHLEASHT